MHSDDIELGRAASTGDPQARDRFAERMRCIPRVLGAKNRRSGSPLSPEDLADLCQETFSVIWSKLHTYAGRAKLETWAARYCLYLFMNSLRRKRRIGTRHLDTEPVDDDALPVMEHVDRKSIGARVQRGLEELPSELADVLAARLIEQAPFEAIAERARLPLNTVRTRYYRGLKRLLAIVGEPDEEG